MSSLILIKANWILISGNMSKKLAHDKWLLVVLKLSDLRFQIEYMYVYSIRLWFLMEFNKSFDLKLAFSLFVAFCCNAFHWKTNRHVFRMFKTFSLFVRSAFPFSDFCISSLMALLIVLSFGALRGALICQRFVIRFVLLLLLWMMRLII